MMCGMKKNVQIVVEDHRKIELVDNASSVSMMPRYQKMYNEAKNDARRKELLASGKLLKDTLGVISDEQLTVGEYGQLRLSDLSDQRYFCISHARDYSVLAVSDVPLGVDIEEYDRRSDEKTIRHRGLIAKKVFTEAMREEYQKSVKNSGQSFPSEEIQTFTRLWTIVEAVLKAEGTGFHTDPQKHPEIFERWTTQTTILDDHVITVALPQGTK